MKMSINYFVFGISLIFLLIVNLGYCSLKGKDAENYGEEELISLMPLNKAKNEEIIIPKNIYSNFLNGLNPNPVNSGIIERRHTFTFRKPDKIKNNKNKKEDRENKEIKKLISKYDKIDKAIVKKDNLLNSASYSEKGFLTLG